MADTQTQASSAILQLPKELRLTIYDALLLPLVDHPHVPDTYALPYEWPKIDLSGYTSLISSCKQLHFEAKHHFEKFYLPSLTLYFDHTPQLYNFAQSASRLGAPYHDITFSLRKRCRLTYDFNEKPNVDKVWHMYEDNVDLMMAQSGFDQKFGDLFLVQFPDYTRLLENIRRSEGPLSRVGNLLTRGARNGINIISKTISVDNVEGSLQVSFHEVNGYRSTGYTEMRGPINALELSSFNVKSARETVKKFRPQDPIENTPRYRKGVETLRRVLQISTDMVQG